MSYSDYLDSSHWKEKRLAYLEIFGKCEVCGSKKDLNVHHKSYKNLGNEKLEDIAVLCRKHHKKVHFSNKGKFINDPKRNKYRIRGMKKGWVLKQKPLMMKCNRCGKKPLMHFYWIWKNGSKHFMVICGNCGIHKQKKIGGLNIPEITTEKFRTFKRKPLKLIEYFERKDTRD